jgi:exopolysaccharide production protein ExoZ
VLVQKLRSIQVLRAVAACAVVLHHAYLSSYPDSVYWTKLGAAGVDLFFVISGFIIATIPKRPTFLLDRVWRIYPIWYVAVLPWLLTQNRILPVVVTSLTLWPVYDLFYFPALAVGWSLCFEMLFYVAAAAALRFGAIWPLLAYAACFVLGFATPSPLFDYLGSPMVLEFLMGVLIARLPRTSLGFGFAAAGIAGMLLAPMWVYDGQLAFFSTTAIYRVAFWGIPAALIVYGCLSMEARFKTKLADFPVLLGDASYSIYLFHLMVILPAQQAPLVEFAGGVLLGLLAYWLIERRLIAIRRRGSPRSDRVEQPAPSL